MTRYIFLKKILNKLNPVSIILFVVFFTSPVVALPQQRKTGGQQLLTLPPETMRLDSLSNMLVRKTGFVLSFDAGKISPGTKMIFPSTKIKLNALLSYLHKHYRLTHRMIGNHIILYNDASPGKKIRITQKIHKDPLSGKKNGIPDEQKAARMPLAKKIRPLHTATLLNVQMVPSFRNLSPSLPKEIGRVRTQQNHILQINSPEPVLYSKKRPIYLSDKPENTEKPTNINKVHFNERNGHFYASAGLTASEVLYMNSQIRIGFPWLFGLTSWETNFKASGFFYGLGTSVKLSNNWDFQLSASSGALSKSFRWPTSTSDTIGGIRTRLTRLDILAEKHLSKRWTLQFGPVLNFMGSKYSLKDSSRVNSFPPADDVSKDIYILNPPYTLSNSYKQKTGSGKKIWVGFRIGLFYTLW